MHSTVESDPCFIPGEAAWLPLFPAQHRPEDCDLLASRRAEPSPSETGDNAYWLVEIICLEFCLQESCLQQVV